ncbi:hypothetical protein ABZ234_03390 [Nocardiopsis sp. NPDC006198]|uniref:hypothetical protein n=1 Tax=Nocardiopsis sp. NPDC006198 TaxID=3154472 RepID=UPI0033A2ACC5
MVSAAADAPVADMSLRAIALVRAVHHRDDLGVLAALDGLDATGVAMVAVQGARLTGNLIADNSVYTVDQVCRKLEHSVRAGSQ